jgi:hypothetical protein
MPFFKDLSEEELPTHDWSKTAIAVGLYRKAGSPWLGLTPQELRHLAKIIRHTSSGAGLQQLATMASAMAEWGEKEAREAEEARDRLWIQRVNHQKAEKSWFERVKSWFQAVSG